MWTGILKVCISYGMMPSEYWQSHPLDIAAFIDVHKPVERVGMFSKDQFDSMSKSLDKFESSQNG